MSLEISVRQSGDVTILDLRGRSVEPAMCELLHTTLQKLVASGVRKLLLDMTGLIQLDSYCVTLIVRTHASLCDQGGDLKLLHARGHVLEVFKTLNLLKLIPCFSDEADALASFGPLSCAEKI